jgi:hypothetical protein
VWKFDYQSISTLKMSLSSARTKVEAELSSRNFTLLKASGPFLYIAYLRGSPPGPFPLTAPFAWPRVDREALKMVMDVAFSSLSAQALYAHYRLAARSASGTVLRPAGRVDLILGRRIASSLPEDHPARHRPPTIETVDPVLFYDSNEE